MTPRQFLAVAQRRLDPAGRPVCLIAASMLAAGLLAGSLAPERGRIEGGQSASAQVLDPSPGVITTVAAFPLTALVGPLAGAIIGGGSGVAIFFGALKRDEGRPLPKRPVAKRKFSPDWGWSGRQPSLRATGERRGNPGGTGGHVPALCDTP